MRTRLSGWLLPLVLLGVVAYALAEDITLTTYYPSPRGVYKELRASDSLAIGAARGPWQSGPIWTLPAHRLLIAGDGVNRVDPTTCPAGTQWYDENTNAFVDDGECKPTVLINRTGNVGIGTTSPAAALEVKSKSGGFLPPRMTTGERAVLTLTPTPALEGLVVYNTDIDQLEAYDGSQWKTAGATSHGLQLFDTAGSHSFMVPDGVTSMDVELWGGGGGGGRGYHTSCTGGQSGYGGGGGGAGGYGRGQITVTPRTIYNVMVGGGGNSGQCMQSSPCSWEHGGNGGESNVKATGVSTALIYATGGQGGRTAVESAAGGVGGTSNATVNLPGQAGGNGGSPNTDPRCGSEVYWYGQGGRGGNAPNGGTGASASCSASESGNRVGGGASGCSGGPYGSGFDKTGGSGRVVISW